jgi:two-component system sensor histidine kinase CpxA
VPEGALERIFEPFYRVEAARARAKGGTGFGLAITQRAVTLHGGSVKAENVDRGGLRVTVRLPLAGSSIR